MVSSCSASVFILSLRGRWFNRNSCFSREDEWKPVSGSAFIYSELRVALLLVASSVAADSLKRWEYETVDRRWRKLWGAKIHTSLIFRPVQWEPKEQQHTCRPLDRRRHLHLPLE